MTPFDWIVLALILLLLFAAPDRSPRGGGARGKPLRGRGKIIPPRSGTGFTKPKES